MIDRGGFKFESWRRRNSECSLLLEGNFLEDVEKFI